MSNRNKYTGCVICNECMVHYSKHKFVDGEYICPEPPTPAKRSVWTATHETQKPLPKELEIDEFTEEDLKQIFKTPTNKDYD